MSTLFLTGGNRGLGRTILEKFVSNGFDAIVSTRKPYADFEEWCRILEEKHHKKIYHIYMDLASRDSIKQGLKVYSALGVVPSVLVNNASMPYDRIALMCKIDDIEECFQVNYFSVVQITQKIAKGMIKQGGCIVNISSVSSMTKQAAGTGYSASKAAINVFTVSLAQELAPFKIRVNAVAPGAMDTSMFAETNELNKVALTQNNAAKRLGNTTEVAEVVYFLSSEKSSYINGQIIRVDGGLIY